MKNMNFMVKRLVKATFMVALLFAGQSLVAQSISTQAGAYTQSNQTKATISNASYLTSQAAVQSLKTELIALADQGQGASEAETSLRSAFYTSLASKIDQMGSVDAAVVSSASDLATIYARYKQNIINVTEAEIFQDAVDLVSN